jgi:hypothetical protein
MPATRPTTLQQRQEMMQMAQAGLSYREIALQVEVSFWTARKWVRRTRAGEWAKLVSVMGRPCSGPLAHCHPLVRYLALRLKRQHPQWGAGYIVQKMTDHPVLCAHPRPAAVSVWRYWRTFGERLGPPRHVPEPRPPQTGVVHGVWQLDFNESVDVPGVGPATFAQARDSVGRATVMQRVHPAWQANQRIVKLTTEQVQADCRIAFAQWGLPDAIQTDRASLFVDDDATPFPTRLSLWWIGLGLTHQLIPRHTPECNGSVERSHRTTNERTLSGQAFRNAVHLQAQLDADWLELNTQCPSRAPGCDGKPPLRAYPDLLRPRRFYFAEEELCLFDLQRIDAYLTHFTWVRLVNSHGQVSLGNHRYGLGRAWAGQKVSIRFDRPQRAFGFTALQSRSAPGHQSLKPITRPAQGLSVLELCGPIEVVPVPPQQLSFPWALFFPTAAQPQARLSEMPSEARV